MDTLKIIAGAQDNARQAKEGGVAEVRLPVMNFGEWAGFFGRLDDLAGREDYRSQQKRAFYFKHFLERCGIGVTMVTCRSADVIHWAEENDHPVTDNRERTYAVAHFVNQPDIPPAQCVHKRPLTADMASSGLELYATLATFGESPDRPELLSAVIHTRDGWVVESLEVLAVEHDPPEAFGLASELMARHGVKNAFQDRTVRRPEFCPDCGELLVNVAGPQEYGQLADA